MYGKFKTRLNAFWHSYIPPICFPKILFLVLKVSNWWIFQKWCFMKVIWYRISIQTLLFQACLPTRQNGVENRDKAHCAVKSIQTPQQAVRVKGWMSLRNGMWHGVRNGIIMRNTIYAGNKLIEERILFSRQFYKSSSFFDAADSC